VLITGDPSAARPCRASRQLRSDGRGRRFRRPPRVQGSSVSSRASSIMLGRAGAGRLTSSVSPAGTPFGASWIPEVPLATLCVCKALGQVCAALHLACWSCWFLQLRSPSCSPQGVCHEAGFPLRHRPQDRGDNKARRLPADRPRCRSRRTGSVDARSPRQGPCRMRANGWRAWRVNILP
jgi:hypothetical protein